MGVSAALPMLQAGLSLATSGGGAPGAAAPAPAAGGSPFLNLGGANTPAPATPQAPVANAAAPAGVVASNNTLTAEDIAAKPIDRAPPIKEMMGNRTMDDLLYAENPNNKIINKDNLTAPPATVQKASASPAQGGGQARPINASASNMPKAQPLASVTSAKPPTPAQPLTGWSTQVQRANTTDVAKDVMAQNNVTNVPKNVLPPAKPANVTNVPKTPPPAQSPLSGWSTQAQAAPQVPKNDTSIPVPPPSHEMQATMAPSTPPPAADEGFFSSIGKGVQGFNNKLKTANSNPLFQTGLGLMAHGYDTKINPYLAIQKGINSAGSNSNTLAAAQQKEEAAKAERERQAQLMALLQQGQGGQSATGSQFTPSAPLPQAGVIRR